MAMIEGVPLLQAVSERIIIRFLRRAGHDDARQVMSRNGGGAGTGVDLVYSAGGQLVRIKVKPDPYFGTDPAKVTDRSLTFYRPDAGHYAFESISNHMTREPGWMFSSDADQIYYYYLALSQSEQEIAALSAEPDGVFFGELKVERDELHILPMKGVRHWFEANYELYTPRPVTVGDHAAWYRLIPCADIDRSVAGIKTVTPVFAHLTE